MYHPQSPELKEASPHGTQSFPCAFYQTQMSGHGFMVKHHWHKEAEILYFPGGNFRMEINMEAFDIRSECFYFINPGELHSVRAASTEVVQEYAVVFHPELLCSPFYDTVQSQLIQPLQNGQLHAGDVLPSEQEWAEALSIKKRDVRPILKNLEMTGVLSCSKEGEMTLSKDMSDSMEELLHVMFLIQKISPYEVCQMRRAMELSAFPMVFARRERLDLDELKNLLDEFRYGNGLDSIRADEEMHRWLIKASGNRLMECVMQGIWDICSAQINLILSDSTEKLRQKQATIHEKIYKSLMIGDLKMGMGALQTHYDIIEQALADQSLYELSSIA